MTVELPPETSEPLSNVDSAWLRMEEPTNLMTITGLMTFRERLDPGRLKSVIEDRLLAYDRFRQRVVESRLPLGRPSWVDDDHFALKAHLHRVALPEPGDEAALQELVSDLMSTPLDRSRPLWQMHVIDRGEGGSALVVRLHHCIGDGVALVRVMFSLTDQEENPGGNGTQGAPSARRRTRRTLPVTRILDEGMDAILNPQRVLELARSGASAAGVLRRLLTLPLDPRTPFHGPLGVTKKAAWTEPVALDPIKLAGKRFGATVNDVLLAGVAGALGRYLAARGEAVDNLSIRAVVPVNLRRSEEADELGNRFGLVFVELPIGIRDPTARLLDVKRRMDEIKSSDEAGVAFGVLGVLGRTSPEVQGFGVSIFGSKATLVLTNVPGPRETIYLAGAPVENIMFWVPQSARLGLGISIFSYAGQVRVGVAVDAGLVPDPDTVAELFVEETDALTGTSR